MPSNFETALSSKVDIWLVTETFILLNCSMISLLGLSTFFAYSCTRILVICSPPVIFIEQASQLFGKSFVSDCHDYTFIFADCMSKFGSCPENLDVDFIVAAFILQFFACVFRSVFRHQYHFRIASAHFTDCQFFSGDRHSCSGGKSENLENLLFCFHIISTALLVRHEAILRIFPRVL